MQIAQPGNHLNQNVARRPSQIDLLIELYAKALAAADPMQVVPPHLPPTPRGRTVVVGMGKAAAAMARAVEANWEGPLEGVVVVPEGAALAMASIRVHEASHPVPDERSVIGAKLLMQAVSGLSRDDLVIALVSGGGSSLCSLPVPGITLAEKQSLTRQLLERGATIAEINTVRRHLSAIKGGRLAAQAQPAKVVTLLISDIPGDEPTLVASGPTLPDPTTCADALAVLDRYGVNDLSTMREALRAGAWESVKPGDRRLNGHEYRVVASAWDGLAAAARQAQSIGLDCHILSDSMEGEARELAKAHAAIAIAVAQRASPFRPPCVILSGGEATVTVRGAGRGGRNTEFALALALALEERSVGSRICGLSLGTDGMDGCAGAAGAWVAPHTLSKARALGLDARQCLDANDSARLLGAADVLVHTGPTFTNINDFRAILIEAL